MLSIIKIIMITYLLGTNILIKYEIGNAFH